MVWWWNIDNFLLNTHAHFVPSSRRSRARRTRQSRQATQPVPMDVLEHIKKHDEEMSKSEAWAGAVAQTPPHHRSERRRRKPHPLWACFDRPPGPLRRIRYWILPPHIRRRGRPVEKRRPVPLVLLLLPLLLLLLWQNQPHKKKVCCNNFVRVNAKSSCKLEFCSRGSKMLGFISEIPTCFTMLVLGHTEYLN